ncbi:MAG: RloB family protein [Coriobacteriales bacterium]|nr:RloB family protein [Coriobacteriales bacterium]
MGTDDLFKKKRQRRRERKIEHLEPKPDSYLIVCEGEKTEPLYLRELASAIGGELSDRVDVPIIDIEGEGASTVALVKKAMELRNRANFVYQHVWVVFDKDDFDDFDEAIQLAEENEIDVAWSNPSFELWVLLHFHYIDSALDRHQILNKVDRIFKDWCIRESGYEKNLEDLYTLLSTYGQAQQAYQWAEKLLSRFDKSQPCSTMIPATTVHRLVRELEGLRYVS